MSTIHSPSQRVRLLTTAALFVALSLALGHGALASGQPPVPNAGGDRTVNEDTVTTFTGTATDPESDTISLSWEFPGGQVFDGASVDYTFADPGTFEVTLWANDGTNNESDTISVDVLDTTAPTVVITDSSSLVTAEDTAFTVDGSASYDFVGITQYYWTVHDVDTTQNFDTSAFSYTWAQPGAYRVTLSATDDAGNTASGEAYVTVLDITAPTAVFTVESPFGEDTAQTLDGTESTDNVGVVAWTWTVVDFSGPVTLTGNVVTYTWWMPGTYDVTLTAADAAGNEGTKTVTVTVLDTTPPAPILTVPSSFNEDTFQTLDASASWDNVAITSWDWTVGRAGGTDTLSGEVVTYMWTTPGTYEATLTVSDAAGNQNSAVAIVSVADITPPTAVVAASDRFKVENAQTLDGSGSSDNVAIDDYEWTLTDGTTTVVLAGAAPSYTWTVPGLYTVTLTVTDEVGLTNTAFLTVTALENVPPVAVIDMASSFNEDTLQTIDGTGSTDNVGVVSWSWTLQDALGTVTLDGASVSKTWTTPGTYTVTLTVADAAGNTGSASTTVTVLDVTPPVASFSLPSSVGNVGLSLDGSYSSDNVGIASWTWTLEDVGTTLTRTGSSTTYTWSAPGTFAVSLTVADAAGNTHTKLARLHVVDTTAPVVAAGSDKTVNQGTTVSFDGTSTYDNDPAFPTGTTFTWTFTDGGLRTLTGALANYFFQNPGIFQVSLAVADAAGNTGRSSLNVTVVDTTPPTAAFSLPYTIVEGTLQTLDGSASVDNVAVTEWAWTLEATGFKTTLSGASVQYTFETPGVYTVTLLVRDAAGHSASKTVSMLVLDITAPHANAGADIAVDERQSATLDASASTDNSPDFATTGFYTWFFNDRGTARTLSGGTARYAFAVPGVYPVTLLVVDGSGNFAMDMVVVTVRDTTAPTAAVLGGASQSFPEDTPVTLDATPSSDNDPSFAASAVFEWDILGAEDATLSGRVVTHFFATPGVYPVQLTARDLAGNAGTFTMQLTILDTTAPVAGGTVAATVNEDTALALDGTLSTDNVGVTSWEWTVQDVGGAATHTGAAASHTWSTPGVYLVTLSVQDAAGLTSRATWSVRVRDTTAPTGTAQWSGPINEGARATFSSAGFTDNDPTFADTRLDLWTFDEHGVYVELRGSSVSQIFATPGTYTISLSVVDAAGNAYTQTHDLVVKDTTAPWLTVFSPGDGTLLNTREAVVTGHFEPGALLSINGVTVDNLGSFAERVTLVEGANVVTFQVKDAAGNTVTQTLALRVDSLAPVVSVTTPADGALTHQTSVRVEGRVSDASGVTLSVNGVMRPVAGDGTFWAVVPLAEGANVIEILATDAAGNQRLFTQDIVRDTKAPAALLRLEGAPLVDGVPTTSASAVDIVGRVETGTLVELSIEYGGGVADTTAVAVAEDGSFRTSVPLAPGSTTWFTVKTTDRAGNSVSEVFHVAQVGAVAQGPDTLARGALAVGLVALAGGLAVMAMRRRGRQPVDSGEPQEPQEP